jgi:hypothetical protein
LALSTGWNQFLTKEFVKRSLGWSEADQKRKKVEGKGSDRGVGSVMGG